MLLALTGLAAAAAASYAGYATMSPVSQLYGRTLTHGRDPRQVFLTYDAYDWKAASSDAIQAHIERQMNARKQPQGQIILLHDGGHLAFGTDPPAHRGGHPGAALPIHERRERIRSSDRGKVRIPRSSYIRLLRFS